MSSLVIREMLPGDAPLLQAAFVRQGWHKDPQTLEGYFADQCAGRRQVWVAMEGDVPLGYLTVLWRGEEGPFVGQGWPLITDFNVFVPYQRRGVGTRLMDKAEQSAFARASRVCLGVGLHSGYGAAQRMYAKRGYLPDGSGAWWQDKPLAQYAPCENDDDLVLYLYKDTPVG